MKFTERQDYRSVSVLKILTGYRPYSHSELEKYNFLIYLFYWMPIEILYFSSGVWTFKYVLSLTLKKSHRAFLSRGTVCYAVQGGSNFCFGAWNPDFFAVVLFAVSYKVVSSFGILVWSVDEIVKYRLANETGHSPWRTVLRRCLLCCKCGFTDLRVWTHSSKKTSYTILFLLFNKYVKLIFCLAFSLLEWGNINVLFSCKPVWAAWTFLHRFSYT